MKQTPCSEADYIYMHTLLGTGDRGKHAALHVNEILRHQNDDGGWSLLSRRAVQRISYGVKAYLALKLMG